MGGKDQIRRSILRSIVTLGNSTLRWSGFVLTRKAGENSVLEHAYFLYHIMRFIILSLEKKLKTMKYLFCCFFLNKKYINFAHTKDTSYDLNIDQVT